MRLSTDAVQLFYQLNTALLFYVNDRLEIAPEVQTVEDFIRSDIELKAAVRNKLYDNAHIIDDFYEENPAQLTEKELGIVLSWKNFIRADFVIYKQYKKYCAFIQEDGLNTKVYAVLSLVSAFDEIVPFFPCYASTVLLPFKESIIYDGLISPYNMHFGSSIRANFKESFEISKAKYGIINKLPYVESAENRDANLLSYYLKNDDNMQWYEDEIDELINKDRQLLILYHQEIGKRNRKKLAKSLKEKGLSKYWFAIYDDVIIASGKDRKHVEDNTKALLSPEEFDFIHIFQA
jgi:hypothetical protein